MWESCSVGALDLTGGWAAGGWERVTGCGWRGRKKGGGFRYSTVAAHPTSLAENEDEGGFVDQRASNG